MLLLAGWRDSKLTILSSLRERRRTRKTHFSPYDLFPFFPVFFLSFFFTPDRIHRADPEKALIEATLSSSHIRSFRSYNARLYERGNLDRRSNAYFYERYPSCSREERVGAPERTMDDEAPAWASRGAQCANTMLLRTRAATFDIHRPCASNRAPPRREKERAVSLFEIHGAFSVCDFLSLSLFHSRSSFSRDARQPRDVKYFRGG